MVESRLEKLQAVLKLQDTNPKDIKAKLNSIVRKYPYFHLAQLYQLIINDSKENVTESKLFRTSTISYQRTLLKKWLEESKGQDKNPKNKEKESNKTETTQSKRIDQFINNPITSKVIKANQESTMYGRTDLSKKRLIHPNRVYTETLAELYLTQKQFQKAIEVFCFLRDTDSKKSDYFARRIDEVKQKINQSGTEL
ncbi:MAG: hypothetical protein OXC03_06695 [Flavobacteriaceae bacterium]|nr:hypothetical protein [Flavobacteriaceae bacterium]